MKGMFHYYPSSKPNGTITSIGYQKVSRTERLFSWVLLLLPLTVVARLSILVRQRSGDAFAQVDAMAAIQLLIVGICGMILLVAPKKSQALGQIFRASIGGLILYYMFFAGIA